MNNNRQPMNNNNNNRRRGRNNNNRPQNNNNRSGFDYLNQIDNKARGNASQMLEKYKKLASDAQLNGDRVTAESYLQFADHYFRVLADFRSRQEARQGGENQNRPRDEWRDENGEASFDEQDQGETSQSSDSEGASDETDRDDRPEREARPERQPRRNDRGPNDRGPRPERSERQDRPDRNANRTPRRHHSEEPADDAANEGGLDLAVLPPSIAMTADLDDAADSKPARKPRARRPKTANDEDVATAAE
jgi:Domain of unknown function (DUF4167)